MPRKTRSTQGSDSQDVETVQGKFWLPNDAPWGGFINVTLSDGDKNDFHAWDDENRRNVPGLMDDLISDGMKYGVAYDRANSCYIVTLTGALIEKANLRCCVTSRAGTWAESDSLAVWKHLILCDGNYGDLLATGRKRSWG